MAANGVRTTSPGMRQAETIFEDTHHQLMTQLMTVQNNVEMLMGGWGGDAASAFDRAMTPWSKEFRTVIRALDEMLSAMGVNRRVYDSLEEQNILTANQLNFEVLPLPGV